MDDRRDVTSPVRDYGKNWEHSQDVDDDAARRHQAMYIGLRLPKRPRRPHRTSRKSRDKKHQSEAGPVTESSAVTDTGLSPSEIVQDLLGDEHDDVHSHSIFCQMDILASVSGDLEWQEAARWVKYEEDVDEGGERWSKPHVASLSLHALFELRSCLTSACIMLDTDALTITQVVDLLLDNLISSKLLEESLRGNIRDLILSPHRYQHQKRRRGSVKPDDRTVPILPVIKSISDFGKRFSDHHHHNSKSRAEMQPFVENLRYNRSVPNMEHMNGTLSENASSAKLNQHFMRKIPEGAEAASVFIGEMDNLSYQVCAFVRLSEGRILGDITEVPIPSRFIFILLGPTSAHAKNFEIGRSMSTIMVDQVFREVAYRARSRQDILAGIDEFLDQVTVLPPGEWDPSIRIEPPLQVPSQEARKHVKPSTAVEVVIEVGEISHADPSLQRSGRLFGGLVNDIKGKLPHYLSDFKDSAHVQCLASFIFLFLVTLTPNVTFGGVLGEATDNYMGTMECILSAAITGVLFALFAGQPLNILGSTGPMLVLEMIVYRFCDDYKLDYMPFRFWIGAWTTAILLIIVAFDLSALVRFITRFTEESFACLIAIIFIFKAFEKLFGIVHDYPFHTEYDGPITHILNCTCFPPPIHPHQFNDSYGNWSSGNWSEGYSYSDDIMPDYDNATGNFSLEDLHSIDWSSLGKKECLSLEGLLIGPDCDVIESAPDVFFCSCLLFIGTFAIAMALKAFKTSHFFPTFIRQTVSDFSVLIAIIVMVGLDAYLGIATPKLSVPTEFKPTRPGRSWFINPISDKNPWWLILAAILPALLATILVFMDQQITAVIVNRKENKLKKGSGYHLDLFVVAICIFICSILGLPWFVAATVSALAHIMSLKKESECNAPGEHPTFLGVREQRVTALLVGILSGCCVLFTGVLRVIPLPVLYGVFFYMGIVALNGMQLVDRILIMMMPQKYQPDSMYLRHVRLKRVHIFTIIQVLCLAVLYAIKTIESVSIIFPLMVVGTCFVRKALDRLFTQRELKWLDDIMPDASKREKEDAKKKKNDDHKIDEVDEKIPGGENIETNKLAQQKYGLTGYDRVNISEEMSKTGIWMQLRRNPSVPKFEDDDEDENTPLHNGVHGSHKKKKRRRHKNNNNDDHKDELPSGGGDELNNSPELNHKAATFFIDEESDLIGIPEENEIDDDTKC